MFHARWNAVSGHVETNALELRTSNLPFVNGSAYRVNLFDKIWPQPRTFWLPGAVRLPPLFARKKRFGKTHAE
jgi:hypothetical protein